MPATKKAATKDHLQALAARTEDCIAEVARAAVEAIEEAEQNLSAQMTGATANAAGTKGMVPQPAVGKQGAYLRGDAMWADPVIISSAEPSDKTIIWFKTEAPAQANANEE